MRKIRAWDTGPPVSTVSTWTCLDETDTWGDVYHQSTMAGHLWSVPRAGATVVARPAREAGGNEECVLRSSPAVVAGSGGGK